MGIDLYKLITHLDEVKIEVGPLGGRTLLFEQSRFKMNDFVRRLMYEKQPLSHSALKKIEKLNHALPENLSLIQKILTSVRQFFGNLGYNRDKDLFSLSLLFKQCVPDTKPKLSTCQVNQTPLAKPLTDPDCPIKRAKPLPIENSLHLVIVPRIKNIKFTKEEPKKVEKKKAEVKPPSAPSSASIEPPTTDAKPKLSRTRSFKTADIFQTLREKCEIDDMALVSFAKDIEASLAVSDKDYFVKLNSVIKKICGEPLIKYVNEERVEVAFKNPECIKILQYALIRLFTTDKMNFVTKSRLIENIASYFPIDLLKAFFEAYIEYIKNEKKYYPDKMDDTFKYLMIRYTTFCKENASNCELFKKEDIAIGIGSTLLKDSKEAGWLEELVDRYKGDKEILSHLDAFLKTRLRPDERRVCRDKVTNYLEAL